MHGVGAWHLVRAGDGTGDDSTHTHREANDAQRMGSGMDRAWGQSSACAAVDGNALLSIGIPRIRPTRDSPMLRCDADESEPTTRMSDTDSTSVGWAAESLMRRAMGESWGVGITLAGREVLLGTWGSHCNMCRP